MKMEKMHNAPPGRDVSSYARTLKNSHETADDYVGVIVRLDECHRVIICKDAIQWIIQVKRNQKGRQETWRGRSYLTTPEAVMKLSVAFCGPLAPDVLAKLQALPAKPGVAQ